MACDVSTPFLHGPTDTGPYFPNEVWEVLESVPGELGNIHAGYFEVMIKGEARCRACGQLAHFDCGFPGGYRFHRA